MASALIPDHKVTRDLARLPPERARELLETYVPRVRGKFVRTGANTLRVVEAGAFEFVQTPRQAGYRVVLDTRHSTWEMHHPTLDDAPALAHTLLTLERVLLGDGGHRLFA